MKKTLLFAAAHALSIIKAGAKSGSSSGGLHAEVNRGNVTLTWSAGIQSGATGFSVQRSADGKSWQEIGQLEVATGSDTFRLTDEAPLAGRSSYRLRISSRREHVRYSNVCDALPDCSHATDVSFLKDASDRK